MSNSTNPSLLKNWRLWLAIVLFPIVGFAAWRGVVTTYDVILKWRSERLAGEADGLFVSGKAGEARRCAAESLEWNPANPEALRLLAKLQIASGEDLPAMATFKKLSATGSFSPADAVDYARLAGRLKKWEVADRLLKALRAGPKSVETPILESELALMRGDIPRAEACLREAANIDPSTNSRSQLADFLIAHRLDHQTAPEAYELLAQARRLQTSAGAQFLASALEKNLAPPLESPKWIQELRVHPNRSPAMLLAADTAEVRRDAGAKPRVAAELFNRVRSAPLEDRKAGMLWLLANGEPARAADLLQQSEAAQEEVLFESWLEALAQANRPAEISTALEMPRNPLKDWRKSLQRGRSLHLAGRSSEARTVYRQALAQAQTDPASALEAVVFLGRAGDRESFEIGLSQLVLDPAQTPLTLRALMPVVRGWRDTVGLRRFCELLAASPGLSEEQRLQLQNEIAYCDLVLGRKVDVAAIDSASAHHPGDLRFQTTRALAHLRNGKSEQAVGALVITQAPPDDSYLLARHKAVQAMALAANGDRDRAEIHFAGLSEEFLSPQESSLVRSFLKKAGR